MKTKITTLILGIVLIMIPFRQIHAFPSYAGMIAFDSIDQESVEVDTIVRQEMSTDELNTDSFPTEEQFKEVSKNGDTTFITLGNKKIKIIESNGETEVKIVNKDDVEVETDQDFEDDEMDHAVDELQKERRGKNFKGHWAGFEFGLNNYVDKDLSLNRNAENEFMDVNTSKSWNFNLNFAQYSAGFGTDHIGLVTGMGLEWNNYHLSDSSIQKLDGAIVAKAIPESTTKNRLQTTYLTIPLLLELQFPGKDRDDRVFFSAGVIGGVKLFSNTKIKYVENGTPRKEKLKGDYYLSPLRYGFTARAGYKAIKLYVNYYPTPLFMADRGPELYPVAGGLIVSF
jgi:hypothetical protein